MIYNNMVKRVLIYGEPKLGVYMRMTEWRRINATEMDELRRSIRISKLDRKTNEYVRKKKRTLQIQFWMR